MEFGKDFDQTAVDLWHKKIWNVYENPCHIFNRAWMRVLRLQRITCKKRELDSGGNMTGILVKIPCHFMSQIDGSLAQIDTKFRDYSMSFIQVWFVFHAKTCHGFYTSSIIGIFMAYAKLWWEFHRIWSHFWPNCREKDMRKSLSHFLQGIRRKIGEMRQNESLRSQALLRREGKRNWNTLTL